MIFFPGENIWVIGASSGIGRALSIHLAKAGARVAVSARRKDELDSLAQEMGEGHVVVPLDVADAEMMLAAVRTVGESMGRIDRVIFLSAIYHPMRLDQLDLNITKHMLDVNVMGAFHLIHAVLPMLKEQKSGQIALCASVAGYVGLPGGQPYSATKAAIQNLAESLCAECPPAIDVKIINPGFVKTPLTDKNDFHMPMMMSTEAAAEAIARGLKSSVFEIHFPKRFTYFMKFLKLLPASLQFLITRKI